MLLFNPFVRHAGLSSPQKQKPSLNSEWPTFLKSLSICLPVILACKPIWSSNLKQTLSIEELHKRSSFWMHSYHFLDWNILLYSQQWTLYPIFSFWFAMIGCLWQFGFFVWWYMFGHVLFHLIPHSRGRCCTKISFQIVFVTLQELRANFLGSIGQIIKPLMKDAWPNNRCMSLPSGMYRTIYPDFWAETTIVVRAANCPIPTQPWM